MDKDDIGRRMKGAVEALQAELAGLRTGRASTGLLEAVNVDAYGAMMPMNQVASLSVLDARTLSISIWDANLTKAVEKAIMESDLGLNPQTEGNVIRLPLPDLTEERRIELTKVAGKMAENSRVAVRNVRRDAIDQIRKSEKDGDVSKDESHRSQEEIQKLGEAGRRVRPLGALAGCGSGPSRGRCE
ncbi:MAG: ribosome recycling factor, partial [Pseudomonadota bacterium]